MRELTNAILANEVLIGAYGTAGAQSTVYGPSRYMSFR